MHLARVGAALFIATLCLPASAQTIDVCEQLRRDDDAKIRKIVTAQWGQCLGNAAFQYILQRCKTDGPHPMTIEELIASAVPPDQLDIWISECGDDRASGATGDGCVAWKRNTRKQRALVKANWVNNSGECFAREMERAMDSTCARNGPHPPLIALGFEAQNVASERCP